MSDVNDQGFFLYRNSFFRQAMLLDVDEEELPDQLENDFSDEGNRTASFCGFNLSIHEPVLSELF